MSHFNSIYREISLCYFLIFLMGICAGIMDSYILASGFHVLILDLPLGILESHPKRF